MEHATPSLTSRANVAAKSGKAQKSPRATPSNQISFEDRLFLDVVEGLQRAGDATTTPGFFKRLSKTLQKKAAINNVTNEKREEIRNMHLLNEIKATEEASFSEAEES